MKNIKEIEKELMTSVDKGLSDEQVEINRQKYGINELESKKKTSLFVKFLLQFKDVLIIILLIAAVVSIIIDPHEWVESLIILIVVVFNAILGVFQENKAEKSLEALKQMSSPTSKVLRNGSLISIPSSEVVVGDIMLVEAGDSISADARIIECSSLKVEEASLTGESVPVDKNNVDINDEVPIGDQKNMIFSSTYVTNGKAKAIVTNVGMNTEIGKIASMLNKEEDTETPLQHKLAFVGKIIGLIALVVCIIVFILEMVAGENWIDAFKTAIALAVAAIPEGLATVVTIVLSIGVSKMSKRNAVVKKLPAVETLGSTNVVCSDKTGTLTQNRMTVVKLYLNQEKEIEDLTEQEKKMIHYFAICCDASINKVNGKIERIGDPTELALLDVNLLQGYDIKNVKRIVDIPFDSDRKLMTTVIKEDEKYIAITKGAPDVVFNISTNKKDELNKAIEANSNMAENALRVLALGIKEFNHIPTVEELEKEITLVGLVGMIDPARDEVKMSIALAKKAGIRTVMITGDHIVTATAIARQLGILNEGEKAITSQELDELSDEYLNEHIAEYSVYARVAPKDKVRIVKAWQNKGALVAMTGDGVNDAPALKIADIGCAMGITGTDVSKEAADMILMDDNFTTIIEAVKQGRGIYDNIQKCVKYLLSSNIGEVITIFVASLIQAFGFHSLGVPLSSIHLLWINLITDSLPAFGIGMEEVNEKVMENKPRDKNESFFANKLGLKIALEGIVIGLVTLTAFLLGNFVFSNQNYIVAQTMAFLTLSMTQLFHAYNVKSNYSIFDKRTYKNKFMNMAFIIGFVLQIIVIYSPFINDAIFGLVPLNFTQFIVCIGLSLVMTVIMEISKLINRVKYK